MASQRSGGETHNSSAEEVQIMYVDIMPSRGLTQPSWAVLRDFLQKHKGKGEEKSNNSGVAG